ncbi:MAG: 3-deoxy-7-phosphoheptulonate synthase [Myxococcales bacterium FL481]|nr:MAG: 3-deoxy-7-phosphoheptulonate synthase [Myxococcales bacterium FL481]
MIIVLRPEASRADAEELLQRIEASGCKPLYMPGSERVVLGALGDERVLAELGVAAHPMVEEVKPILAPYKLVSREVHPHDTVVGIGSAACGGEQFVVIGGGQVVGQAETLRPLATAIRHCGATALRGSGYSFRSAPYVTPQLDRAALDRLAEAARASGLPLVTEVRDLKDLDTVAGVADLLHVSARNMTNFGLLHALGSAGRPVLLERGPAARVEELLLSAEHLVAAGNEAVILCERGIRTFETATRATLDLNAVPWIKQRSHLPVIVDPCQGTGVRSLVLPMAKAAAACGADGLLVELDDPAATARADAPAALPVESFSQLMTELRAFLAASGRRLA